MSCDILLAEGIHQDARNYFEKIGWKVQILNSSINFKESQKLSTFLALGIRSKTHLNKTFFENHPALLSVGAFCIGTNQIDLQSATSMGVAVFNSPYSNTRSVAELVIANVVNLSRRITHFNHLVHAGKWEKTSRSSYEIRGKILGIIGYGHIGSQVGILAESLGMQVLYYDIKKKLSLGNAKATSSLEELLSQSDFVTLHVPQTPETIKMITQKELKQMKPGKYLINTSRGPVVILEDLVESLKSKHLLGAAIDVFPEEPSKNQETFSNELQQLDNVILTPHIGGSTEEAQVSIAKDVSESLVRYLTHGDSTGSVNFPQLSPPPIKKNSLLRISNIHQNKAGTLSQINHLIAQMNVNVKTQYLSTTSDIGYLIMDLESIQEKAAQTLIQKIQNLNNSIKTRIL